jgi:hypothetical protein
MQEWQLTQELKGDQLQKAIQPSTYLFWQDQHDEFLNHKEAGL